MVQGRTVDFRNTVVIMTSNLGRISSRSTTREGLHDEMKAMLMEVLTRSFRPEFINRIDETVVFPPLGEGSHQSPSPASSSRA